MFETPTVKRTRLVDLPPFLFSRLDSFNPGEIKSICYEARQSWKP